MTTRVENSTLRPAEPSERQPVNTISPLASSAALSMLIHPMATTTTMAMVIRLAAAAFSRRWMRSRVSRRVIENSTSLRFSKKKRRVKSS